MIVDLLTIDPDLTVFFLALVTYTYITYVREPVGGRGTPAPSVHICARLIFIVTFSYVVCQHGLNQVPITYIAYIYSSYLTGRRSVIEIWA